jgi:anti-anti-sigma regulatory factor
VTGTTAIIKAPASFDDRAAPPILRLLTVSQAGGATGVVFDLGATTHLADTAPGVIAGTHAALSRAGGRVAVAAEPIARLIRATGPAKLVLAFGSSQEAVSFLQLRAGQK